MLSCGYSLVVKHQPSKLAMRVRFPLPAPFFPNILKNLINLPLPGPILVLGSQMRVTAVVRMIRQRSQIVWKIVSNGGSQAWVTSGLRADCHCEGPFTSFVSVFRLIFGKCLAAAM